MRANEQSVRPPAAHRLVGRPTGGREVDPAHGDRDEPVDDRPRGGGIRLRARSRTFVALLTSCAPRPPMCPVAAATGVARVSRAGERWRARTSVHFGSSRSGASRRPVQRTARGRCLSTSGPRESTSTSVLIDVHGAADLTNVMFNGKVQKLAPAKADFARACKKGGWKSFPRGSRTRFSASSTWCTGRTRRTRASRSLPTRVSYGEAPPRRGSRRS